MTCVIGKPDDEMVQETNDKLGLRLYEGLIGGGYDEEGYLLMKRMEVG